MADFETKISTANQLLPRIQNLVLDVLPIRMAPACFLTFIMIVHPRFLSWGWLRGLFSFSPWHSSTSTLPKRPPAKETIAQQVILIWRAKPWLITEQTISSMKIYHLLFVCIAYSYFIAGLVITGGNGTETSIETFPADCSIPPFPGSGNLSSRDYQHFIHSPPKGEMATPSLSYPKEANLWLVAAGPPRLLASLGGMGKRAGKTSTHWGEIHL